VLPPGELPGFAGRLPGPGGLDGLFDDLAGLRGVFLEVGGQPLAHHRLDDAPYLAVAQLGLGLPFKLGSIRRTLSTAVKPSRTSSPVRPSSLLLSRLALRA